MIETYIRLLPLLFAVTSCQCSKPESRDASTEASTSAKILPDKPVADTTIPNLVCAVDQIQEGFAVTVENRSAISVAEVDVQIHGYKKSVHQGFTALTIRKSIEPNGSTTQTIVDLPSGSHLECDVVSGKRADGSGWRDGNRFLGTGTSRPMGGREAPAPSPVAAVWNGNGRLRPVFSLTNTSKRPLNAIRAAIFYKDQSGAILVKHIANLHTELQPGETKDVEAGVKTADLPDEVTDITFRVSEVVFLGDKQEKWLDRNLETAN